MEIPILVSFTPFQEQIYKSFMLEKKEVLVESGRRSGKTFAVMVCMLETLLRGESAFYVVPQWSMALSMLRDFSSFYGNYVKNISKSGEITSYEGGLIKFCQFDKGDRSLRGDKHHRGFIDEGAYSDNLLNFISAMARPTLSASGGNILIASTPKLDTQFYHLTQEYKVDSRVSGSKRSYIHGTIYDNPTNSLDFINEVKRTTKKEYFDQEYLAIPTSFDGVSFFNVGDFKTTESLPIEEYSKVFITMDTAYKTGASNDGTGHIVWGVVESYIESDFGKDWGITDLHILDYDIVQIQSNNLEQYVKPLIDKYNKNKNFTGIFIEDKGSGQTLLQQLQNEYGSKAIPLTKNSGTNKSKTDRAMLSYRHVIDGNVKFTSYSYEKQIEYKETTDNWLLRQIRTFKAGKNNQSDDLIDCLSYGIIVAFEEYF